MIIKYFLFFLIFHQLLYSNNTLILTPGEQRYLQNKKEITICFNAKGLPLFGVEKGKDVGIFPDTVALIEEQLGIPFRTIPTESWQGCIEHSKQNKVDIAGLIVISPNKHTNLTPSIEVASTYLGIVTKITEPYIADMSEIKGKSIALFSGQTSVNAFIKDKLPYNDFVMVSSVEEGLQMVADGLVYAYGDETYSQAYYILKSYSNELKIMKKLNSKPILGGFGVRKNEPELLSLVNKAVKSIDLQEFRDISHKWISVRVETGFDYTLVIEIVLVLFLILLMSLYWIDRLSKEIQKRLNAEKALQKFNENLETEISIKIQELHYKDAMLQEQTKLAAIGEMMAAIAHQWRRPLSTLHINIEMIEEDYKEGKVDDVFLENFISINSQIIQYMSQTIDDFQNFYKLDKTKKSFDVIETIQSVLNLRMYQLEENGIGVQIEGKSFSMFGYPSEFQQVILNLISNAKDALTQKKIECPCIKIDLSCDDANCYIRISDNAGGIKEELIGQIFEPYFTSKSESGGTGLGLYVSKMIIEKNMRGEISMTNKVEGLEVLITLGREEHV